MSNLTSVHVTAGIPDAGTGTVSTIDELILVGLPLTGGTVTVSGTVTSVISGTAFVSGGTVTAVVSGTTVVSSGNITSALNQAGGALSSTNGIFSNILFNNTLVSASVGLPVNIVTYAPLTAVVSGTTFVSGGTVTAVVSGTATISGGNVTAAINQGGNALSSTNGVYSNILFNNTLVSASVGLPVNLVSYAALTAVISGTTFISGGNVTSVISGTAVISGGNVTAAVNQGGNALSSTNGIYSNILFNNTMVTATNGLPVNIVSGTVSVGNITAALNQGGNALSSTNGIYANILFNNALVSASVGLPVNLVTYAALTAVISGTAFVSGGNITAVVSGTTFISGGNVTAVVSGTTVISSGAVTATLNQGGNAISSTNGIFANMLLGNSSISSTNPLMIEGDTASAVADANNPVKIGGLAKSVQATAVTDGQRVNALFDLLGKQVVVHSIRALKANVYTSVSTTGEVALIPSVATTFNDIYGAICANTSGSTIQLTFKDSVAGTTQFVLEVPGGDTRGFMMPESAAYKQTTQNNTWTVTPSLATSISISMLYVKNATS